MRTTRARLLLVLAALGLYVLGGITLLGLALWSSLDPPARDVLERGLRSQAGLLVVAGGLHAGVLGVLVAAYFGRYVTGTRRAAADTRIVAVANPAHRLAETGPPEVRDLAAAVNLLAERGARATADADFPHSPAQVAEQHRDWLLAAISQLSTGVLVCSSEGLIVLYNRAAGDLLGQRVGLGRSVLALVDREVVARALAGPGDGSGGEHTTIVGEGAAELRVQVRAVGTGSFHGDSSRPHADATGLVLTVEGDPNAPPTTSGARRAGPVSYDFGIRYEIAVRPTEDRRLSDLAYTVLDTETTGLDAASGDEIVSLAAVRVVNGRVVATEAFDRLVDPGRRVSARALEVHGISDAMLAGQPRIDDVLPAFAAFASDTVLVGHNVSFDLQFLAGPQARTGVRLDNPVLDTLLLSAALHPDHGEHALDAIATRLGVDVVGRHTALGDALVTADVLVRLLRLLEAQGVDTLGEAMSLMRSTEHARHDAALYPPSA